MPRKAETRAIGGTLLLSVLGVAALVCFAVVADLSARFVPGQGHAERPIIAVLVWLGAAFLTYLGGLWVVGFWSVRLANATATDRTMLGVVIGFAIACRIILVPTNPIQEIDIYRYLWDGQMTAAGVNPFAYSPDDALLEAGAHFDAAGRLVFPSQPRSADGARIAAVLERPTGEAIFRRVDHPQVPTIYPAASQGTFALAVLLTPGNAGLETHVTVMKLCFLAFDIGAIAVLVLLLRSLALPAAWCLVYAWCPLVIKEFANSGHLDAQAVFFTLLAALALIRGWRYGGAAAWAVAVLSKVYPILLFPLVLRMLVQQRWRAAVGPVLTACAILGATHLLTQPNDAASLRGLRVFATEWEMNDPLFHLLSDGISAVWDSASQQRFAESLGDWWPRRVVIEGENTSPLVSPAFMLTNLLVGFVVAGVSLWFAFAKASGGRQPSAQATPGQLAAEHFLRGIFYTLAVLFVLGPTANPWYWTWALPFLPWARRRAWLLLSAIVLQYYLYFWFYYHYPPPGDADPTPRTIGGRSGREFFNEVWTWVEFGPFYAALLGESLWCWWRNRRRDPSASRAGAA
jgi:hypothetical protein